MRVLTAHIGHETNTFASVPTTLEDFRKGSPDPEFVGGQPLRDIFRGTGSIHGGFLAAAERHGMILEPLLWAWANPGGLVDQVAYDTLKGWLLERMKASVPCDGVLLDLHGAMVTEAYEDAEGDLIRSVREVVGKEVPVVVTLDLHANITAEMAVYADVILGFDEYPHNDMYDRGVEAAQIMAGILRGDIRPALAYKQLPFVTMPPKQCTFIEPMRSLLETARAMEREPGVVNVTLSMGFPFADIPDAGVSVLVTTNGDPDLAQRKANEMATKIWRRRDEFNVTLTPVSEAIAVAMNSETGLTVFADGSDNPGGGGPCDGTVILKALIDADAQEAVVAVIADPEAVALAMEAGVGSLVTLDLGGKTDDRHGEPVHVTAYVRLLSDGSFVQRGPMGSGLRAEIGKTAVLVVGGVEIVVTERRFQPLDAELLRSVGIEPSHRRIVALKSAVHFRSTYTEIADRIFDMDTPGVHRPDFSNYEYRRLRRPVYPLDPNASFG